MGVSAEYILKALEIIKENGVKQNMIADSKKNLLYVKYPELEKFNEDIADVFKNVMKEIVDGKQADFKTAESESLKLQAEREKYIKENNIDIDSIKPVFLCKKCSDTGYYNGRICECVKNKAIELSYEELNKDVKLDNYTFDNFDVSLYPKTEIDGVNSRELMKKIYSFCLKYAENFDKNSENLFFFGNTGLGKTHLSLSIVNKVIKKGYNVIYGPISKIIGNIENQHFSSNTEDKTLNDVLECDLLVLDDLGTEFTSQFVVSTVFDIINTRILNKKPTIINTNLEPSELNKKYSDRVISRIKGNYRMLNFVGKDIRTL